MAGSSNRTFGLLSVAGFLIIGIGLSFFSIRETVLVVSQSSGSVRKALGTVKGRLGDRFPFHDNVIEWYGGLLRALGRRTFNNTVVLKNGMLSRESRATPVKGLSERLAGEAKWCSANGFRFLFALAPEKMDLDLSLAQPGFSFDANAAGGRFVRELSGLGIDTLDLRRPFAVDAEAVSRNFFRTDIHWNFNSAREAAAIIAARLGAMLDDPDAMTNGLLAAENWAPHVSSPVYLGANARRTGSLFCARESVTWYLPRFETRMSRHKMGRDAISGTFEDVVMSRTILKALRNGTDLGDANELYGGGGGKIMTIRNPGAPSRKRIVVIKDSFGRVVSAFLTTVFSEVTFMDPRRDGWSKGEFRRMILEVRPDAVLEVFNAVLCCQEPNSRHRGYIDWDHVQ